MVKVTTCAICSKPLPLHASRELKTFPFCSNRCQEVDLLRWMGGKYAVVEEAAPEQLAEHLAEQAEFDVPGFDSAE